ncbi:MAG TPA: nucleoside phosphorylase [Bacillota bacterium]|nr:nucleoside phosphorylase [Bacillota bacterium]
MSYPILEYDSSVEAIIEPSQLRKPLPHAEFCVITFFPEIVEKVKSEFNTFKVGAFMRDLGDHPLYQIEYQGKRVGFYSSGVGAPLAAYFLEQAIACGYTKFVACGGAGVLKSDIQMGKIIIPAAAIRDEGTSYHYYPPSREIQIPKEHIDALAQELERQGVEYMIGKTWTTDAPFRETKPKIDKRKQEGCLTVEMECSALAAVCQFRKVKFAQYLYGADDVSGAKWDHRGWTKAEAREKLFWASVNACLKL